MFLHRNDNLVYFRFLPFLQNNMIINWRTTFNCNFNCAYCGGHDNNKLFSSLQQMKDIIDFIAKLDKTEICLNITGGEASTHPNFFEMLEYMVEVFSSLQKNFIIRLFSNLSKPLSFYDRYFKTLEPSNLLADIFASFHKEFINEKLFIQKYKYINSSYGISPFAYMLHNPLCVKAFNKLTLTNDKYIQFAAAPLFGKSSLLTQLHSRTNPIFSKTMSIYYEDGEYSYKRSDFDLTSREFRGFMCKTFGDNIFIDTNGELYYCILSIPYTNPLSIYDKDIHTTIKNKQYSLCPVPICNCDTGVTKINYKHLNYLKNIDSQFIKDNIRNR